LASGQAGRGASRVTKFVPRQTEGWQPCAVQAPGRRSCPANTWVTYPPFVWLPAMMVLVAWAGHILVFRSLQQPGRCARVASVATPRCAPAMAPCLWTIARVAFTARVRQIEAILSIRALQRTYAGR